jgi:transcription elongation GreA/GreB family factor
MVDGSTVGVGSWVTVRDGALEESWRVVDPIDADAARRLISTNTPLARALLGHRAGEFVRVQGPERRTVVILQVGP